MLVSWDWLNQYVKLDMSPDEAAERLMMAGLNHEDTHAVGKDLCINLEVTSNRPDCLGHIGIAREVSVLWNLPLTLPKAAPKASAESVNKLAQVRVDDSANCPRYTARVIRGVKVGPSPAWLVSRLATVGIGSINNVVDITNYVLLECGQPLHAFDLGKLAGGQIIVRAAKAGEEFLAINHKKYTLDASMCVIADAQRAVALAGVMGGSETEVSQGTTDLLIESAEFAPMSIRATARKLNLHSDSSYRFERGVDPRGIDWASRRCCELILELAGGTLGEGVIDLGPSPAARQPVTLRFTQLKRILGIEVEPAEARRILSALGNKEVRHDAVSVEVVPPSWRRDLSREIDLIEEVARVHGYDKIPEDVSVPMAPSHRTLVDRVLSKVRQALCAAGFDEALTLSAVEENWSEAFSPWTEAAPIQASTAVLRRANRLRRSIVPSLLGARQTNESLANPRIELFESAHVYLPRGKGELPGEELMLAVSSGGDYLHVKGVIEGMLALLDPAAQLQASPTRQPLLDEARSAELHVQGKSGERLLLGYLGEVATAGLKSFDLRGPTTVAELKLSTLIEIAQLIPQYHQPPVYPAVTRDLNLVVDESVLWADLAQTVRAAAGEFAESLELRQVYRDDERLGAGKKSLLLSMLLRSAEGTLTGEEADAAQNRVIAACQQKHAAQLRA